MQDRDYSQVRYSKFGLNGAETFAHRLLRTYQDACSIARSTSPGTLIKTNRSAEYK